MGHTYSTENSLNHAVRQRIRRLIKRVMKPIRQFYLSIRKHRLTNQNFSIIGNNCVAAIMYHDLGQRFDSPTINLWIPNQYFFEFLNHLDYYIHAKPEQIYIDGIKYPVGRIQRDDCEILIHFMHYTSFDVACHKWIERAQRLRKDNHYIVFNTTDTSYIDQFSRLEFEHKVMLTRCDGISPDQSNLIDMPIYQRSDTPGVILEYKSSFSLNRWLNDFDYISFLNQK